MLKCIPIPSNCCALRSIHPFPRAPCTQQTLCFPTLESQRARSEATHHAVSFHVFASVRLGQNGSVACNAKRGTGSSSPFAESVARSEITSSAGGSAPQERCVNGCQESRQVELSYANFLLALATSTFRLLPRKADCKRKVLGEKTVAHAARLRKPAVKTFR